VYETWDPGRGRGWNLKFWLLKGGCSKKFSIEAV